MLGPRPPLYAAGVDLHPLAEHFASIADVYERGRPEYAPAVAGALSAELGLTPGAPVWTWRPGPES